MDPEEETDVRGETIWQNRKITVEGQPIYWEEWARKGIMRINDLIHPLEGRFLSNEELNNKYDVGESFLRALQIRQSIPGSWRRLITPEGGSPNGDGLLIHSKENKTLDIQKEPPKKIYSFLLKGKRSKPKAEIKWEQNLGNALSTEDWNTRYMMSFRATRETRLQSLQYKILHRTLPCRKYLKTIRVTETDSCSLCGEQDTIQHFIHDCSKTKKLWEMVGRWSFRIGGPDINALTQNEIIFGIPPQHRQAGLVNFLTMYTKFYIYRQKLFHGGELGFIAWLQELKRKLLNEQLICTLEKRASRFGKWHRILKAIG